MLARVTILYLLISLLGVGISHAQENKAAPIEKRTEEAIFAMGCFWCGESEFRDHVTNEPISGIVSLRVGYAGGKTPDPTYENHEGYKEALKISYDPSLISYKALLDIFWHNVDLFDDKGQFCDKGFPYTSVIYYKTPEQKLQAESTKKEVRKLFKEDVVTEIIPFSTFYDAEEYHQNYRAKNPVAYKFYRWNCGRDKRLKEIWSKIKPKDLEP